VAAVMGDFVILVYNFHVPLALKVGYSSSGVGCDIVVLFLCVGLIAVFCGVTFSLVSFLLVCILLFLSRGVVCLGCWWSFCVFRCHSVLCPFEMTPEHVKTPPEAETDHTTTEKQQNTHQ
jgi:hypothetical protein